ncbi:MAG: flavin reductase family protein [Lysobacteraceae bacterium]
MLDDPHRGADPQSLRQALGRLPTGVCVVTTTGPSGPAALTVGSFAAVSLSPPLVLWSLMHEVWPWALFAECGHYAVHVLGAGQQALSNRFATPDPDRHRGLDASVDAWGLPRLDGCLARLACEVVERLDRGDHRVLLGRVLAVETGQGGEGLVHERGRYLEPKSGNG